MDIILSYESSKRGCPCHVLCDIPHQIPIFGFNFGVLGSSANLKLEDNPSLNGCE
jgi:hypothetical protein